MLGPVHAMALSVAELLRLASSHIIQRKALFLVVAWTDWMWCWCQYQAKNVLPGGIPLHSSAIVQLSYSRDGARLATASIDKTVSSQIWNTLIACPDERELLRMLTSAINCTVGHVEATNLYACVFLLAGKSSATTIIAIRGRWYRLHSAYRYAFIHEVYSQ